MRGCGSDLTAATLRKISVTYFEHRIQASPPTTARARQGTKSLCYRLQMRNTLLTLAYYGQGPRTMLLGMRQAAGENIPLSKR